MPTHRPASPLLPGFDFLKTLAGQAGKGLEGLQQLNAMGQGLGTMANGLSAGLGGLGGLSGFKQWVAPTLDPDELEKRIEELRTVQFWLEQNARLLGATIQALEVQKMTLSTLRSMDVKMPDLQQVLGAMMPQTGMNKAQAAGAASAPEQNTADEDDTNPDTKARPSGTSRSGSGGRRAAVNAPSKSASKAASKASSTAASKAAKGAPSQVDPMKWWGALTEQFQQLAAQALASTPVAPSSAAGASGQKNPGSRPASGASTPSRRKTTKAPRGGSGKG